MFLLMYAAFGFHDHHMFSNLFLKKGFSNFSLNIYCSARQKKISTAECRHSETLSRVVYKKYFICATMLY